MKCLVNHIHIIAPDALPVHVAMVPNNFLVSLLWRFLLCVTMPEISSSCLVHSSSGVQDWLQEQREKDRFSSYSLFMAARQQARAGLHRATIQDGVMFFLATVLSNTKLVPVKDHNKMGLGCGNCPILNGGRHQKVPRERGSGNDKRTHKNA